MHCHAYGTRAWIVVERYKDGGIWMHHYCCKAEAERNMILMQEAHPHRTYDIEGPFS